MRRCFERDRICFFQYAIAQQYSKFSDQRAYEGPEIEYSAEKGPVIVASNVPLLLRSRRL